MYNNHFYEANGDEILIETDLIENVLRKELPDLSELDIHSLTEETAFRMADGDYTDFLYERNISPEVYYALCSADCIHDGYTIPDIVNFADDGQLFDFTPSDEDERIKEYMKMFEKAEIERE